MRIFKLTVIALACWLTSCTSSQFIMDSDYDIHGQFRNYKSFAFMNNENSGNGDYEEQIIQQTIMKRFLSLGYQYDEQNPDLIISCKFFYQPTKLIAFNQFELGYWLKHGEHRLSENGQQMNGYYKYSAHLPADSYTIFLVDAKTNRMIWKGFSGQPIPWTHEQQLVASISRMLDDYSVIAY